MLEGLNHADRCPADSRRLVLASSSPRRQELLRNLGLDFEVDVSEAPEIIRPEAGIAETVEELALQKAQTVAARQREALVIAADTLVSLDGSVLGKPANQEDACRMLRRLSGRMHSVFTGLILLDTVTMSHETRVVETNVYFRQMSDSEIEAYVATGEPLDKAGSYGMQRLGAVFVSRINGDYFNVIGLPLLALNELLKNAGCCIICRNTYAQGANGPA